MNPPMLAYLGLWSSAVFRCRKSGRDHFSAAGFFFFFFFFFFSYYICIPEPRIIYNPVLGLGYPSLVKYKTMPVSSKVYKHTWGWNLLVYTQPGVKFPNGASSSPDWIFLVGGKGQWGLCSGRGRGSLP